MRNSIITQLEFRDGVYQGQSLQSRYKQGLGVYLWENGSAYYGEWKSDQIDGVGILFLPPRITIQGHFTSGKLNGPCVIQTRVGRYYGKWLNGLPDGAMTSLLKDGEVTIAFQDGKPCRGLSQREFICEVPQLKSVQCYASSAIQVLELSTGTFYGITGKDSANKITPNGLGVFVPIDGLFSCGEYKNGVLCGFGRFQQPTGEIYQGYFENGKFHGKGIYLFKEQELQWAKGLWRFGELLEIYESGLVRDCQSPKDVIFPYSNHKNPITIKQPINLNNIKELEDLFESQFSRQEPICNHFTNTPERLSKQPTHKYFQNSLSTSYKRISEALLGKPQVSKSPQPDKLIKYYKGQLQDVDLNEQHQQQQQKSFQKKSMSQKQLTNSKFVSKPSSKRETNKSSNKRMSQSAYVDEIKKLQTQFTKPFEQNKSVESQQSQIYQVILDQEEQSEEQESHRSGLFVDKKVQESPIDQIISRSQQYKKEQSIEQQRKSLLDQSKQSNQSKQQKDVKQFEQSSGKSKARCKSTEGRKPYLKQEDHNKIKSEGNKIKQIQFTNQSQQQSSKRQTSQLQESVEVRESASQVRESAQQIRESSQPIRESSQIRQASQNRESSQARGSSSQIREPSQQLRDSSCLSRQPKDTKRSQESSLQMPISQRISIKSYQDPSKQTTPQQSHRQQFEKEQVEEKQQQLQQQQETDHSKKLSFCQQDFAADMRNTAIFNQSESNSGKMHRHKRSQSQTDLEKNQNDDTQMQLVRQQQQYMQQLIEQQQKQLQELKLQQQLLEEEQQSKDQPQKPGQRTNVSMDSLESYPQQSESFHQDFIKSVSDVLKNELKRKQEDSLRDFQNNSPHFEQSKITNNQQSMFFNDQQSLENVSINERPNLRKMSQQEDANKSRADSSMVKKQPVSHCELDDLQSEKQQDVQSRQSRNSRYSMDKQRSQSQSSQRNPSVQQQHSFHHPIQQQQPQPKLQSEENSLQVQVKQQELIQAKQQEYIQQKVALNLDQSIQQDNDQKEQKSISKSKQQIMPDKLDDSQSGYSISSKQFKQVINIKPVQQDEQPKQTKPVQQQSTIKKGQNDSEQSIDMNFKSNRQSKQPSQTQLRYVASPSQQLLPYQIIQSDKQFQIKPDQQSENIQVQIMDDNIDTKQNIEDIKLQLAAQREILSQLYNSIQESRQLKVSQFESEKRVSEQRTVKRGMISTVDPCSSPIKKVIITKGAFPAFTIIKSLSPIRL